MHTPLATKFSGAGRRAALYAVFLACLAVIGTLDYLTGYEISFAVFYLIPVGMMAWLLGARAGLSMAVLASVAWYSAEIAAGYPYSHPAIPVWNAMVRLVFFASAAVLLVRQRAHFQSESILARTDPLTSLGNRRVFIEQLEHDLALSERNRQPLTLAYVDIDNFKQVNDRFGHAAGDDVLRAVAARLSETQRRSDTSARLGGDEFAIILPGADESGAGDVLSRLVTAMNSDLSLSRAGVTCSIGAVVFRDSCFNADEAIRIADQLMYSVKNSGKSSVQIAVWPDTVGAGRPSRRRGGKRPKTA